MIHHLTSLVCLGLIYAVVAGINELYKFEKQEGIDLKPLL
jgi:hypothetical protein